MSMTLQLISIGLMVSNFQFLVESSLSGIKKTLKFQIHYIQFSEAICTKKLDYSLVLYTTFTIDLELNYLLH